MTRRWVGSSRLVIGWAARAEARRMDARAATGFLGMMPFHDRPPGVGP
jgi:hypothetical protein